MRPDRNPSAALVVGGGSPTLLRFPLPMARGDVASDSRGASDVESSLSATMGESRDDCSTGKASGRFGGGDDDAGGGEPLSGEQTCGMSSWKGELHAGADVS